MHHVPCITQQCVGSAYPATGGGSERPGACLPASPQVHPALAAVLAGLHEGGMLTRRRYEAVAGDVRLNAEIWKVRAARWQ
jgi:hypothetical protein